MAWCPGQDGGGFCGGYNIPGMRPWPAAQVQIGGWGWGWGWGLGCSCFMASIHPNSSGLLYDCEGTLKDMIKMSWILPQTKDIMSRMLCVLVKCGSVFLCCSQPCVRPSKRAPDIHGLIQLGMAESDFIMTQIGLWKLWLFIKSVYVGYGIILDTSLRTMES